MTRGRTISVLLWTIVVVAVAVATNSAWAQQQTPIPGGITSFDSVPIIDDIIAGNATPPDGNLLISTAFGEGQNDNPQPSSDQTIMTVFESKLSEEELATFNLVDAKLAENGITGVFALPPDIKLDLPATNATSASTVSPTDAGGMVGTVSGLLQVGLASAGLPGLTP